jgi:carbon-monoxide dehydrogenase medium subunit
VAAAFRPGTREPGRGAIAQLVGFGCGATPVRLAGAEAVLAGARIDAGVARAAGEAASHGCTPADDLHGSADYRRHLVAVLTEQVVLEAAARLGA